MRLTAKDEPRSGELHFIPIEFTDEKGDLLPYVEQPVTVKVEGAKLLGLGSALCKTDERYDSATFTTYRGRLLAVVQATQTGKVKIMVSSDHVPPVTLDLEVKC